MLFKHNYNRSWDNEYSAWGIQEDYTGYLCYVWSEAGRTKLPNMPG